MQWNRRKRSLLLIVLMKFCSCYQLHVHFYKYISIIAEEREMLKRGKEEVKPKLAYIYECWIFAVPNQPGITIDKS